MNIREFVKRNRHFGWQNAAATRRLSSVHHTVNERHSIKQAIRHTECDGRVGIIIDSTDCDMCLSTRGVVVSSVTVTLSRFLDQLQADAEGLTYTQFVTPEQAAKYCYTSRDLALEAFENGHQHIVYR